MATWQLLRDSPELGTARELLSHRRLAVVGVSRNQKDFSRVLLRELLGRGFDAVPVNPAAAEVEGRPCYARVQDVSPPVDFALLLTPPHLTEQAVRDCLQAGVRRVWMHRGAGGGAASPAAVRLCRANGVALVSDLCPFMVLPRAGWFHRAHAFLRTHAPRPAQARP
jgi:predicted CoA-binding protein